MPSDAETISKDDVVLWLEVALNNFMYLKVCGAVSPVVTFSAWLYDAFGEISHQTLSLTFLSCCHMLSTRFLLS